MRLIDADELRKFLVKAGRHLKYQDDKRSAAHAIGKVIEHVDNMPTLGSTEKRDIRTIGAEVTINETDFVKNSDVIFGYVINEMKRQFADALTDFVELEYSNDKIKRQRVFRSKIYVVDTSNENIR